ncbi:MAG: hypothetical protein HY898_36655 [Deltaproteobacteria bacterium]|nr:hypothetical protein [Deltaproteobacteria bacterium]
MSMHAVLPEGVVPIPSALPIRGKPGLIPCQVREADDDGEIEDVVRELCAIHRARSLSLSLDVGAIVVERLFGGDVEEIRRRGRKDKSLRKLASHPRLPFSAATLWRAIAIYEMVRRFPGLVKSRTLGVSHLRSVIGLPPSAQERLLRAAEVEKWDTERLEKAAAALRSSMPKNAGGRPPLPSVLKTAASVRRIVDAAPVSMAASRRPLDARQRDELRAAIELLRNWCDEVERNLIATDPLPAAVNQ